MSDEPVFSPRQGELVRLAAHGLGQVEMARHLGISSRTVSSHLNSIYLKLGIAGYGAGLRLTRWALTHGYAPGPGPEVTRA